MKYLVLRRFRTYGVTYLKGDVIDESVIRSPRIRQSEGKIIPAVSSSEVPKEVGIVEDTPSKGTEEEVTIDEIETEDEDNTEIDEKDKPVLFKL